MKRKNMVVGMKVLAKSSETLTECGVEKGTKGVIDLLEPLDYTGDYVVRVNFTCIEGLWLTADDIKPAEKREKPLKVGDKVQERKATEWTEGTELTVTAVDETDTRLPYLVADSNGEDYWFSREALRRVRSKSK
jgi:hypothetical protein